MKQSDSGEYVSAHVSQATAKYQQLIQSGIPVESYRQVGDVVHFRTAQPAPLPKGRRLRWWMWIVLAVSAFFVVSALIRGGMVADNIGVGMAGVILFGAFLFIVWKAVDLSSVGFIGTMVLSLIGVVFLIGMMTSAGTMFEPGGTGAVVDACGTIRDGTVSCRWGEFVDSLGGLVAVAQSPASEGLGMTLLIIVGLMFGAGYLYWRSQGLR